MFKISTLNDIDIASDIQNAFIPVLVAEKVYTILGLEFSNRKGKKSLIVRSLYRLRSASDLFFSYLASYIKYLGYEMCLADNNT